MRILIVDDHDLLVEGLTNLLAARGFNVVGSAADGQAGVEQALRLEPDLVLMDIRMPRCDGLTATRLLKTHRPNMKVVILATSAEDKDLFEAVKSGASGYLLKSTNGAAFIDALHGLEDGAPPFSPGLAVRLLREFASLAESSQAVEARRQDLETAEQSHLTERQIEVLRLVASGLTYKEVGVKLALSDHTVRYHMSEIMARLHLENRSQVIAYAGKLGLE
jgi:two-component system NarL family response regulator